MNIYVWIKVLRFDLEINNKGNCVKNENKQQKNVIKFYNFPYFITRIFTIRSEGKYCNFYSVA